MKALPAPSSAFLVAYHAPVLPSAGMVNDNYVGASGQLTDVDGATREEALLMHTSAHEINQLDI